MKGYKATYNMHCRNMAYKVGGTYSLDPLYILEMCRHGFHFCPKMDDVLTYYDGNRLDFILLEVEALGDIQVRDDKVVTDKIKILRVVPEEEYTFKVNMYVMDDIGRVIQTILPDGNVVKYTYIMVGGISKIESTKYSGGPERHHEYDMFGFPKSTKDENGEYVWKGNPLISIG